MSKTSILQQMKTILDYPPLHERLQSRQNPKEEKRKIKTYLREIAANLTPRWCYYTAKFLDYAFYKFYDGVVFNSGDLDIEKLSREHFVVLVPNHQSHIDYVAMGYAFYKEAGGKLLFVAGGENLNFFPMGTIFRKNGCFFIRRTFKSNITYKLTLEAYLYGLLKSGQIVEFFFEGGRSRSGKLRPPRYGFYNMLLAVYRQLSREFPDKKMFFVPVSINNEYVPETKSLSRELIGEKKKREGLWQMLKMAKFTGRRFGSIHITLGTPVLAPETPEEGGYIELTHTLAFDCFREVGRNMLVTPSSLLSMILLDWVPTKDELLRKSKLICNYCERYKVPYSDKLKNEKLEKTITETLEILVGNGKVSLNEQDGYEVKQEYRYELLYLKNNVLHHFLIPTIINFAWKNLLWGNINNVQDVKDFFLVERRQFKHEFYIPTVKHFLQLTLKIVADSSGKKVNSIEDLIELKRDEQGKVIQDIGIFSRSLNYILGAYYLSVKAIKNIANEKGFKMGQFREEFERIFKEEMASEASFINYESYSIELIKSTMDYFKHSKMLKNEGGIIYLISPSEFDNLEQKYHKYLSTK